MVPGGFVVKMVVASDSLNRKEMHRAGDRVEKRIPPTLVNISEIGCIFFV